MADEEALPLVAGRDKDERRRWLSRCALAVVGIMSTLLVYGVLQVRPLLWPNDSCPVFVTKECAAGVVWGNQCRSIVSVFQTGRNLRFELLSLGLPCPEVELASGVLGAIPFQMLVIA